jgi:hypothetical protein
MRDIAASEFARHSCRDYFALPFMSDLGKAVNFTVQDRST